MEKSKRNDKINELINKMDTYEEMEYENAAYFNDLMAMEKSKRNDKINELINKMDTYEEMEYENAAYFDDEYDEMGISMEELFDMLEDNADRLDEVQNMIKDRQDGMLIQTKPED